LLSAERGDFLFERAEFAVGPLHDAVLAAQFFERGCAHAVLFGHFVERHVEVLAQLSL